MRTTTALKRLPWKKPRDVRGKWAASSRPGVRGGPRRLVARAGQLAAARSGLLAAEVGDVWAGQLVLLSSGEVEVDV